MTETEARDIINEVRIVLEKLTRYSESANLGLFLSGYDDSPNFLAFSSDGKMRNYEELKEICTEYYTALKEQKILTIREIYNVIDTNLVIVGWTGDITAQFRNGDIMKMKNYSITSVFRKIDNNWKIIHSHESSLPAEMFKKSKE